MRKCRDEMCGGRERVVCQCRHGERRDESGDRLDDQAHKVKRPVGREAVMCLVDDDITRMSQLVLLALQ